MGYHQNAKLNQETGNRRSPSVLEQLTDQKGFPTGKQDHEFGARYGLGLRTLFLVVFLLMLAVPALAQLSRPVKEMPRSFSLNDNSQDQVERKILPAVDIERRLAEDRARDKDPRRPRSSPLRRCRKCFVQIEQLRYVANVV